MRIDQMRVPAVGRCTRGHPIEPCRVRRRQGHEQERNYCDAKEECSQICCAIISCLRCLGSHSLSIRKQDSAHLSILTGLAPREDCIQELSVDELYDPISCPTCIRIKYAHLAGLVIYTEHSRLATPTVSEPYRTRKELLCKAYRPGQCAPVSMDVLSSHTSLVADEVMILAVPPSASPSTSLGVSSFVMKLTTRVPPALMTDGAWAVLAPDGS